MKTFEEKWTAWVDDQLTGRELEEFLASLPDRAAAEAEKQRADEEAARMANQIWRFGQRAKLDSRRFGLNSKSSSRSACTQSES